MKVKQVRSALEATAAICATAGDRELAARLERLAAMLSEADNNQVSEFVARVTDLRQRSKSRQP